VDCVRVGIKYLVASKEWLKQFGEIAKQLQLSSKKLILDVPTRWNSTYMMLSAALNFRKVFPMYEERDQSFRWVPTVEDWVKVENVYHVLEVFNEVTKIILGSNYPTANLFLPEVWRIRDALGKKCRDENVYIRTMAQKMNLKFEKYWVECSLPMAVNVVLDPRFKMKLVQFCFPEPEATRNIERVRRVLNELYGEYVDDHNLIAGPQRV
jgi:hypothetical protein